MAFLLPCFIYGINGIFQTPSIELFDELLMYLAFSRRFAASGFRGRFFETLGFCRLQISYWPSVDPLYIRGGGV